MNDSECITLADGMRRCAGCGGIQCSVAHSWLSTHGFVGFQELHQNINSPHWEGKLGWALQCSCSLSEHRHQHELCGEYAAYGVRASMALQSAQEPNWAKSQVLNLACAATVVSLITRLRNLRECGFPLFCCRSCCADTWHLPTKSGQLSA